MKIGKNEKHIAISKDLMKNVTVEWKIKIPSHIFTIPKN